MNLSADPAAEVSEVYGAVSLATEKCFVAYDFQNVEPALDAMYRNDNLASYDRKSRQCTSLGCSQTPHRPWRRGNQRSRTVQVRRISTNVR